MLFRELAIQKFGHNNLEAITEWLVSQEDDPVDTTQQLPDNSEVCKDMATSSGNSNNITTELNPTAKSIQCDDCGKLFKTQEEVEFHASKSGIIIVLMKLVIILF